MSTASARHALLVIPDDELRDAVARALRPEDWQLDEGREIREAISSSRDSTAFAALVRAASQRSGRLDLVVWDATELWGGAIEEIEPDEWMRIIREDLDAPFLLARATAPYLARTRGMIAFVVPAPTLTGLPWASACISATAGVLGLARALACELSGVVRANVLARAARKALPVPPSTAADDGVRWDLQLASIQRSSSEVLGPESVAQTISFLASPAGAHYSGHVFDLSGPGP